MKGKSQELGINSIPKDNHIIPINIFQRSEHAFVLHEPGKISDCQTISKIREKITSENKYLEISYKKWMQIKKVSLFKMMNLI